MCPNAGLQTSLHPRNISAIGYGCPGDSQSRCHRATSPFIFPLLMLFPSSLSPFLPPSQPPYLPFPIPPPPSSRLTVSTRSHHQHPTHFLNIIVIFHTIWRALHDPHTLGIANKVPEPPHARAGCAQHRSRPISPPRNRPLGDPKAL